NAGDFMTNIVTEAQSFTKNLEHLADSLTKPLLSQSWASNFTPVKLLSMLSYIDAGQAQSVQDFSSAVHAINSLSIPQNGWVNVGDFTADTSIPGVSSPLSLISLPDLGNLTAPLSSLRQIPGLQVKLDDPQQLVSIMTGMPATLFSYTLPSLHLEV